MGLSAGVCCLWLLHQNTNTAMTRAAVTAAAVVVCVRTYSIYTCVVDVDTSAAVHTTINCHVQQQQYTPQVQQQQQ